MHCVSCWLSTGWPDVPTPQPPSWCPGARLSSSMPDGCRLLRGRLRAALRGDAPTAARALMCVLACVLAQPFEPHVLSGAVTADQVASNLGALAVADRLRADPELLGRIMGETQQDSEAYWAERAALAWN